MNRSPLIRLSEEKPVGGAPSRSTCAHGSSFAQRRASIVRRPRIACIVLVCASFAEHSCNWRNSSQPSQSDDSAPSADDRITSDTHSNSLLSIRDLQVLALREARAVEARRLEQQSQREAASASFAHLSKQERLGRTRDIDTYAPSEWREFTNAFAETSSQTNSEEFERAVKMAQYAFDHAVMTANRRSVAWREIQVARGDAERALSDVRRHVPLARATTNLCQLETLFSNTIATLSAETAGEQQTKALKDYAMAAKNMDAMMNLALAELSHLRARKENTEAEDVRRYAPVEWTHFIAEYEAILSRRDLPAVSAAITSAEKALEVFCVVASDRKHLWNTIEKERDDLGRMIEAIRQNPLCSHATSDLAPLESEFSNVVARLEPQHATSEQCSNVARISVRARTLVAELHELSDSCRLANEWRKSFLEELPTLHQLAPDHSREAERLLDELDGAASLAAYSNTLFRAIGAMTSAFNDADAVRRGER